MTLLTRAPVPRRSRLRRVLLTVLALPLLAALAIVAINLWMVKTAAPRVFTQLEEVPARPAALVLGAGPGSLYFEERLDAAARLFQSGRVGLVLVSGENDGTGYGETAQMRRGLLARGVPETAIASDDAGWRTFDSVARARAVFGLREVVIVTQPFHLPRALYLARARGLDAVGYAATDPGGSLDAPNVREWFARVLAVADVLRPDPAPAAGPVEPVTPLPSAPAAIAARP